MTRTGGKGNGYRREGHLYNYFWGLQTYIQWPIAIGVSLGRGLCAPALTRPALAHVKQ